MLVLSSDGPVEQQYELLAVLSLVLRSPSKIERIRSSRRKTVSLTVLASQSHNSYLELSEGVQGLFRALL